MLTALQDLGIVPRGSGADNIRNITASPTAGIDPQELIDTRPLPGDAPLHLATTASCTACPASSTSRSTAAARSASWRTPTTSASRPSAWARAKACRPGVYFRLRAGRDHRPQGIRARPGVLLRPEECVPVAAAIVRVFIEHGDRTDRKKARLKYVLDRWGHGEVPRRGREAPAVRRCAGSRSTSASPAPPVAHGHIGFHPQRQPGLVYVGVVLPVGRMSCDQMRGLAAIAERHGSGDDPADGLAEPADLRHPRGPGRGRQGGDRGAGPRAGRRRRSARGLVACTGNFGCKFASSRHQAARAGDRRPPRRAARARHADQHPPDRLPEFVRPALHRRHRPAGDQGRGRATTWSRAITCSSAAATAPTRTSAARSTATSRPRTRRRSIERMLRGYLGRARSARGVVPRLHPALPDRAAQRKFELISTHASEVDGYDASPSSRKVLPSPPRSAPGSTASSPACSASTPRTGNGNAPGATAMAAAPRGRGRAGGRVPLARPGAADRRAA